MRAAILVFLWLSMATAFPCLAGNKAGTDLEEHRKVAMTANAETRAYALLHNEQVTRLAQEWEAAHRPSSLRDYLCNHDAAFRDLSTRWERPYDDDKLISVLIWAHSQANLMAAFGGLTTGEAVIKNFQAHRDHFDTLKNMLLEDYVKGLRLIGSEKTEPADLGQIAISSERVQRYRNEMKDAKVTLVRVNPAPAFYSGGHYVVWKTSPPHPEADGSVRLVQDFDGELNHQMLRAAAESDRNKKPQKQPRLYKQIEGNWYLDSAGDESQP